MRGTTFYSNSTRKLCVVPTFWWLTAHKSGLPTPSAPHAAAVKYSFFFFLSFFLFLNFLSIMLKIAHCEILCVNKRRSRRVHRQHTMCTCHVWLCMCHIFAAFCEGHGPQRNFRQAVLDQTHSNSTELSLTLQSDLVWRTAVTMNSSFFFLFLGWVFFEYCFLYIS